MRRSCVLVMTGVLLLTAAHWGASGGFGDLWAEEGDKPKSGGPPPLVIDRSAPLLLDEQLTSWARIALEVIPGPEADAALREAMGKLSGRHRIGVINSIGFRRDAAAVTALRSQPIPCWIPWLIMVVPH